jgi:5-deoxy-glucuronate isomerase
MSRLLVRPHHTAAPGRPLVEITPQNSGLSHVGFAVHRLAAGETCSWCDADRELCLVVLSGRVGVDAGGQALGGIGERDSVFDGLPSAVYAPPATACTATALDAPAEIAACWAPATGGRAPFVIEPASIDVEVRGAGAMERRIHPILMAEGEAEALLVVEVLTPGGHWSSYPPHKHDVADPPHETFLEETYYHRLRPAQGFGLQRVYTDDRSLDEAIAFADGDVVLVPRGYHTVSAPPGYDLYYLNVMAGPVRDWRKRDDPDHRWLAR